MIRLSAPTFLLVAILALTGCEDGPLAASDGGDASAKSKWTHAYGACSDGSVLVTAELPDLAVYFVEIETPNGWTSTTSVRRETELWVDCPAGGGEYHAAWTEG